MPDTYIAILGRQPALSLAELESLLGSEAVKPLYGHALLSKRPDINRLGGTIKLAKVVAEAKKFDEGLMDKLVSAIAPHNGKLKVGLSLYGTGKLDPLKFGMQLKKRLKVSHGSVRLVLPKAKTPALSAAQLKFNGLDGNNPEVIILAGGGRTIAALTRSYQDIDAYTARDFERPGRSAKVGMLPPKLAQILINLSGVTSGPILDPFCGSGVLLQEARLMGLEAFGSDIDRTMVRAATTNMKWLDDKQPGLPNWAVEAGDARLIKIPQATSAIVTEGYLGPAFSQEPTPTQVAAADQEVSTLVTSFLKNIHDQIDSDVPIVLCLPAWQMRSGQRLPQVIDEISRLGYTSIQFAHVKSDHLVYLRPGQIVGRKIIIIRKTNE